MSGAVVSLGKLAPEIRLPLLQGGEFLLKHAHSKTPAFLAFFKVSCPTCQYTLPFVQRLALLHQGNVAVVGISQDNAADTAQFNQHFGLTFPVALDHPRYVASNAYVLTHVPSLFLVSREGSIEWISVGWSRAEFEDLHRRLSEPGIAIGSLWQGEPVADFKAG